LAENKTKANHRTKITSILAKRKLQKMSIFSSKYFTLLKTLSESELKSFDSWLNSPWCNSNKNLIVLLDKIKKYHPSFDNDKLSKEKLFKQVLPKGKYSDRRMNNLLSEGYQAAEKFIIFQKLSQDKKRQKDLLSQEFQSRHLEDWFFRDIHKEITRLEEKEVKDWEDHLDLLRLHRRVYHHPTQNTRMIPGGETIVKMGEELDLVYLLEKAAIINEKIARSKILHDENHEVEEELEKWKNACENIQHPALDFYKMRFAYTDEKRAEQFFTLRDAFLSGYEKLNLKEQKIHLISLLNDSSILNRKGLVSFENSLPLYKLGLKTGILLNENKLTFLTFYATITASNIYKDFAFSKKVIEEYSPLLDKIIQQDAINWAKAHACYYQKKYLTAIDFLNLIETKSFAIQFSFRMLKTKIYFDLYLSDDSYYDYLINYFDTFERWTYRDKFRSEIYKKSILKFVQKCRELEKCYSMTEFNQEKLEYLLKNENNVQALSWLKEKKEQIILLRSSKIG